MFFRTKLFTVHEQADVPEPSERVMLVREGFSWLAMLFSVLWLLFNRLWLEALGYLGLLGLIGYLAKLYGLAKPEMAVLQLVLMLLLGFSAYDLKRQALRRRGYAMTGVVAAGSGLDAERRYYDVLA